MPNHITNILTFDGPQEQIDAMLDAMKQEDKRGTLDFNKIIPMPQSLDVTSGSVEDEAFTAYLAAIDPFAPDYGEEKATPKGYSQKLNMVLEKCSIFSGRRTLEVTPELIEQGKVYMSNIELYGCTSWYEWCILHWGTKWNSYEGEFIDDNQITFLTAWSRPESIIQRLSEMYPDLTIEHSRADEDFGYNCGKAKYAAGCEIECYIPEGNTNEARALASDILGYEWELGEDEELENE